MAFQTRQGYNPKRKIAVDEPLMPVEALNAITYGGNPEHKRNPGDFGLTPPSAPGPKKSLCDDAGVTRRQQALDLLKAGIRAGLVSRAQGAGGRWPQNIWAVTADGVPMEAQLENPEVGVYHGYPIPPEDPFRNQVLRHWGERHE